MCEQTAGASGDESSLIGKRCGDNLDRHRFGDGVMKMGIDKKVMMSGLCSSTELTPL